MLEPPRAIVLTRGVQPSPSIEKRLICLMRLAAKSMPERCLLPREPTRQPFRAARESHLAAPPLRIDLCAAARAHRPGSRRNAHLALNVQEVALDAVYGGSRQQARSRAGACRCTFSK